MATNVARHSCLLVRANPAFTADKSVRATRALRPVSVYGKKYCNATASPWQSQFAKTRCPMLRATFIALSESRSLRGIAERSRIGQHISTRFVAGKEVADAIRAAAAVNQFGAGVSIDNL